MMDPVCSRKKNDRELLIKSNEIDYDNENNDQMAKLTNRHRKESIKRIFG